MLRHSFRIGRIAGIDIAVDPSWFIIFVLFTWSLASSYFPVRFPNLAGTIVWPLSILTSLLVFGSVLVHELAHSLVAIKQGDTVKSITLFILGGVAQMTDEPKEPLSEFVMAVVGPITSFILASIFFMISMLLFGINMPLHGAALYLAIINTVLGVFNLIPGFPMDGGRVLRSIIWKITGDLRKATFIASKTGQAFSFLLIVVGIFEILRGFLTGLWLIFIGWFLYSAAARSYQQVLLRSRLSGLTAKDLMKDEYELIDGDFTVQQLVDDYVLRKKERVFLVGDEFHLDGIVSLNDIKSVPKETWNSIKVWKIMTPREKLIVVCPDTPGEEIFQKMNAHETHQVPVIEGDTLRGIILHSDVLKFLELRSELGKE
ncbi:site-2 protease family protein [Acidobacteriota bacterium]